MEVEEKRTEDLLQNLVHNRIQADYHMKKKHIRKIKKKAKGDKEFALKQYNMINCLVKEPTYEKKIFLLTDIIIDLDAFTDPRAMKNEKFQAITSWRPPVSVRRDSGMIHVKLDTTIDGLSNFSAVSAILKTIPSEIANGMSTRLMTYANLIQNGIQMHDQLKYFACLIQGEINNRRNKNQLGLQQNVQIPHETAYLKELESQMNNCSALQKIIQNSTTQEGNQSRQTTTSTQKTSQYQQNVSSIPSQQSIQPYSFEDYFEELLEGRRKLANTFIQSVQQSSLYLSYVIKSVKRGNIVISEYGYSEPLLHLLGYDSLSSQRLLSQNGPLSFFETEDMLKRMNASMDARITSMASQNTLDKEFTLKDQTIITMDDLRFKCDIKMIKNHFSNHKNYFVQHCFLLQLATYVIDDSVVREIVKLRSIRKSDAFKEEFRILCGIEYELNADIFIQKYYQGKWENKEINDSNNSEENDGSHSQENIDKV